MVKKHDWRNHTQYTPPEQMASGASVHKDGKKVVIIYNDIPSVHKRLKANHLPPPPPKPPFLIHNYKLILQGSNKAVKGKIKQLNMFFRTLCTLIKHEMNGHFIEKARETINP